MIKVFSAISGNYDYLRSRPYVDKLFQDKVQVFKKNRMNAKAMKLCPWNFISSEYLIWIDGNVTLNALPQDFIDMMEDKEILVFKHPSRDCIYDEAKNVIDLMLDSPLIVEEQMNRYARDGWKKNQGLGSCRLIVRKRSKEIAQLDRNWFYEVCTGSSRDQLSFPYVYKDRVKYINHPDNYDNEFFTVHSHNEPNLKHKFLKKINKYFYG